MTTNQSEQSSESSQVEWLLFSFHISFIKKLARNHKILPFEPFKISLDMSGKFDKAYL